MNRKLLVLIALFTVVTNFYGQRRPDLEKLKSLKIAFLTEKLDLSSKEAEAFWPVYNAHEDRMNAFRNTERSEFSGKLMDLETLSENEADELLVKYMDLATKKQNEQKFFISDMQKIISSKKTMLLLKTEEDFKRKLIQQYRQRKGGGGYR